MDFSGFSSAKINTFSQILDIIRTNKGITLKELYDECEMTIGLSRATAKQRIDMLFDRKSYPKIIIDKSTQALSVKEHD